jgi:hypothetical protein
MHSSVSILVIQYPCSSIIATRVPLWPLRARTESASAAGSSSTLRNFCPIALVRRAALRRFFSVLRNLLSDCPFNLLVALAKRLQRYFHSTSSAGVFRRSCTFWRAMTSPEQEDYENCRDNNGMVTIA